MADDNFYMKLLRMIVFVSIQICIISLFMEFIAIEGGDVTNIQPCIELPIVHIARYEYK